ncbi:MAG: rhomboid family intramembrane serine protease [Lachnospiraceae bacterium]|nr:rhomboid family intramembrane serine protease [Lachnospiraceae bacterium]
MDWYRIKRKLSKIAVNNLSLYITVIFAIGYLLLRTDMGIELYSRTLAFYPREVLHGQVWRILTAVFYPPSNTSNILLGALSIFIYYNFASAVERTMGSTEFNIYFFGSFLFGEIGSIIYYLITGVNYPFIPMYTHFSVFMAFAVLYAEAQVLLFFIIPIKVKWVAMVELAIYIFEFFAGGLQTKISVAAAIIPVVVFYFVVRKSRGGGDIISNLKFRIKQKKRQAEWKNQWK